MFFLIRCVFWLTVVFSTIFSSDHGAVAPHQALAPAQQTQAAQQQSVPGTLSADVMSQFARAWVSAALQKVWSRATGSCATAPAECAALAGRLEEFAREHPYEQQAKLEHKSDKATVDDASGHDSVSAVPADVPLPPPRPRRFHQSRLSEADPGATDGLDAVPRARLAPLGRAARS